VMRRKSKNERLKCISKDIIHNVKSLDETLDYCHRNGIGK
jgi:hypothetical protein